MNRRFIETASKKDEEENTPPFSQGRTSSIQDSSFGKFLHHPYTRSEREIMNFEDRDMSNNDVSVCFLLYCNFFVCDPHLVFIYKLLF
jgi:hypothetical protein